MKNFEKALFDIKTAIEVDKSELESTVELDNNNRKEDIRHINIPNIQNLAFDVVYGFITSLSILILSSLNFCG